MTCCSSSTRSSPASGARANVCASIVGSAPRHLWPLPRASPAATFPLGGIQISDDILDVIVSAPDEMAWMHGLTYSGHAAACAVGLQAMWRSSSVMDWSRTRPVMGERLLAGLETLKEFPFVDNIRGRGLLNGLEIVTDRASRAPDLALAGKISSLAMQRGLRVRPLGATLAFSPPLTINEEEIDLIIEILGGVMDSL